MSEQQDREALRLAAYARAEALWDSFTPSEKHGVLFGLFSHDQMQAVIAEGHDGHFLSVALMDLAAKKGSK